jgi:hypothetical protein
MLDDYGELISRDAVWVMEEGGSIVGFVVLLPRPDHLLLDNIAVSPERQGAGSGRKLLAFAEAEAIKRGYSEIRLYTHVKMVENQRLYASIGYEQTEVRVEQGFERVFTHKRLLDDPVTVVRKQLDAYNARDIEAFMACWADDAEIFEHPPKRGSRTYPQRSQLPRHPVANAYTPDLGGLFGRRVGDALHGVRG